MTAPLRVDTEVFTDDFDFVGFVRKVLGGTSGVGSLPTDNGVLDWVERALLVIHGTPYEDRFTRAVSDCLTDEDPVVRREALRFFEAHPQAMGAERVVELVGGNRQLFAGVADPDTKSVDLEWSLLRAVGTRMMTGDERAKAIGREEALRAEGKPEPLIAALTCKDPDWVIAHAVEIVAKHPKTGSTILFNLERVGVAVGDVGELVAPLAARGDPKFKSNVKRYLDDQEAKARILAAASKGGALDRTRK